MIDIKMPDLGTVTDEVTITKWLVEKGSPTKRGVPLLEVETDKAVSEVESVATGTLVEIVAEAGTCVSAGDIIARVLAPEGDAPEASTVNSTVAATDTVPAAAAPSVTTPAPRKARSGNGQRQGFLARNRARKAGPGAAVSESGAIELSATHLTMARRMQESIQTVPHFYLSRTVDASAMIAARDCARPKPVWDAFFVKALACALEKFPRLGCRFDSDRLVPIGANAIGVAIDVDDELYVATVSGPQDKTLEVISNEIRAAVKGISSGGPDARRLRSAEMTVSNLGGLDIDAFTAIIPPPQSAILATGRVTETVVPVGGEFVVQPRLTITLSVDHRVASGKYAAGFLAEVVDFLETA